MNVTEPAGINDTQVSEVRIVPRSPTEMGALRGMAIGHQVDNKALGLRGCFK